MRTRQYSLLRLKTPPLPHPHSNRSFASSLIPIAQHSKNIPIARVRNEKNEFYRFSGIASQRVKLVDPNIEQVKREAPSPSFLQEKQIDLK